MQRTVAELAVTGPVLAALAELWPPNPAVASIIVGAGEPHILNALEDVLADTGHGRAFGRPLMAKIRRDLRSRAVQR